MSDTTTKIRTEPCPHCVAGQVPLDGHTVEELRAQMRAARREPRPEFAEKIRKAGERNRAGRG